MKTRHTLLSLTALAMLAACASSPERPGPSPDRQDRRPLVQSGVFVKPAGLLFANMDINRDTVVTRAELTAGTKTEWSHFNGNPSATGFMSWSLKTLGSTDAFPTFMSFDRDMNGVVTEIEFAERLQQEFSSMDKNKDSQVTRSEMLVAFDAPRSRERGGERQQGGRGGRGGGEGGRGGRPPR